MRIRLVWLSALSWLAVLPAHATSTLYASRTEGSPGGNQVVVADPTTYVVGSSIGGAELVDAQGLALAPNGELFVVSQATGEVHRYDAQSGASLGTALSGLDLVGGGLDPFGARLHFGPDGSLYLGGRFGGVANVELRRYDPVTGALLGSTSDVGPAFAFDPNGGLYGAGRFDTSIERYDPVTLASLGVFATGTFTGAGSGVGHLAFAPDGTLYAMNTGVEPVNFESQVEVSAYDGSGNLIAQSGAVFDPYGHYDLRVHPLTGEVLSLTDIQGLVRWNLSGSGGPNDVIGEDLGWLNVELLFVPESALALLLLLGGLAASQRSRRG